MEVDSIKQKLFSAEVKLYQAENQASYLQSLANQMDQWVQITSVQRRDWSKYHPLAKFSMKFFYLGGGKILLLVLWSHFLFRITMGNKSAILVVHISYD